MRKFYLNFINHEKGSMVHLWYLYPLDKPSRRHVTKLNVAPWVREDRFTFDSSLQEMQVWSCIGCVHAGSSSHLIAPLLKKLGGLAPRKAKEWGGRKQIEAVCYLRMACWVILGKCWKSQPQKVARGRLSTLWRIKGSFHLKLGRGMTLLWLSFWLFESQSQEKLNQRDP
jgi:hypothetical protein